MMEHWHHEFLVFTIIHEERELYLYFERELDENIEEWRGVVAFARALFRGEALDILWFHESGSEKDTETKKWAKAIFELELESSPDVEPFTLKHLARILGDGSYEEKYPKYGLFSANCWAWSRGFLFDITQHVDVTTKIRKTNGKEMVPITLEEMRLYMLTEYGAYGRLLLHFSSDDYDAQNRRKAFPESLEVYGIRIVLLLYTVLQSVVQLKSTIIGPSNWSVSLRTLCIYHDRTLEGSNNGLDCTFLPSKPNFNDFIPITPGHMDHPIPDSFCQPGRYLYLLSSPISTASYPVLSAHIHVFGAISDTTSDANSEPRMHDTSRWLSCGIIRRSEDDGDLIEVPESHIWLKVVLRDQIGRSAHQYKSISVLKVKNKFSAKIKHGDMIALWVHSYPEKLHQPRSASIKIVVLRRPLRMIDWILALLLLLEISRFVYKGSSYISLALSGIGCPLYWTNTFCEGWIWAKISALAIMNQESATPLSQSLPAPQN
ncbi:hypothetical protein CPB83DRAFT_860688 [Crepidotus variabilis]|uniref:Uncharacterized protein n=1 Tax=Crepidotus variabilis TaxID=179855 RepID=A0A9P6JLJ0_9AGAR|nr:hypothetical protein CPB83DRAFT_860688 [Crepidotus variabilis]